MDCALRYLIDIELGGTSWRVVVIFIVPAPIRSSLDHCCFVDQIAYTIGTSARRFSSNLAHDRLFRMDMSALVNWSCSLS